PGHAHEPRLAVHFRAARTALAGFAVPAHRQIVGLLRLNGVDHVQHHHPFTDGDAVIFEFAARRATPPYPHVDLLIGHYFFSSSNAFSSSGTSGSGSCESPSSPFFRRTMTLTLANFESVFG